jgi:hypothetical protein
MAHWSWASVRWPTCWKELDTDMGNIDGRGPYPKPRLCPACSTSLEPDIERHRPCIPALQELVIERAALAASLNQLVARLDQLELERDDCRRVGDAAGARRAGNAYDLLRSYARAEARTLARQFGPY